MSVGFRILTKKTESGINLLDSDKWISIFVREGELVLLPHSNMDMQNNL